MHSTTRSSLRQGEAPLDNISYENEQDLLGALFGDRAHDNQDSHMLSASRQSKAAAAPHAKQNDVSDVAAPAAADILLQTNNKKGKKSHARKQPTGHIPRPRNA